MIWRDIVWREILRLSDGAFGQPEIPSGLQFGLFEGNMGSDGGGREVRSIDVSNFSAKKMLDILSFCSIPPATYQVELHPYLQWDTIDTLEKRASY